MCLGSKRQTKRHVGNQGYIKFAEKKQDRVKNV